MTERSDPAPPTDAEMVVTSDWTQVAQLLYDPESFGDLTTALVYALADAMDCDPTDLTEPLYEYIDVAALENTLFGPDVTEAPRQGVGHISFRYGEFLVAVTNTMWIQVYGDAERAGAE